ncbi:MAG: hypothetical protein V3U78_03295 [Thiotrichaceae bacterium]
MKTLTASQRWRGEWRGFFLGLKRFEIDHFSDHSIDRYVEYVFREAVAAGELKATV